VHPLVRATETEFLDKTAASGAKMVVLDIRCCSKPAARRASMPCGGFGVGEMQRARLLERASTWNGWRRCWRGRSDAKSAGALISVDSSQGIEHAREQVRQILAAVAKMPVRRN